MELTRKGFIKSLVGLAVGSTCVEGFTPSLAFAQETAKFPSPKARKIRDIEIYPYGIPMKVVAKVSLPYVPKADNFFVRMRTDDGVVGYGEGSPYSPVTSEVQLSDVAMGKELAELLRGRDPFTIAKIVDDMDAFSPHNASIKAALEMAVWDICGKIAGQPICNLLGNYRDSFETDKTIFIESPAAMAEAAKEVAKLGFRTIKVKVGEAPAVDIERLHAVREAVGPDIALRIDANQGWTAAEALQSLRGMDKYQLQLCEQPVPYWDIEGLKFVRDHAQLPIMADESVQSPHDVIELIRRDAVDLVNIKLMKSGGILNAVRTAQIMAAAGIKGMLGCMSESTLGLTAAAHVVASQKNLVYADLDAALYLTEEPIIGGMQIKQGIVHMPTGPGLGLEIDPAFLKKLKPA
jgi:L-Ala-D/L-Glu epimerase